MRYRDVRQSDKDRPTIRARWAVIITCSLVLVVTAGVLAKNTGSKNKYGINNVKPEISEQAPKTANASPESKPQPTVSKSTTDSNAQQRTTQSTTKTTPNPAPAVILDQSDTINEVPYTSQTLRAGFTATKNWRYNLTFSNCQKINDMIHNILVFPFIGAEYHGSLVETYVGDTSSGTYGTGDIYPGTFSIRIVAAPGCYWHIVVTEQ